MKSDQKKKPTRFIFVTGGVVSSLGKGISAAALGALLESRDFKIGMLKMDPYINVDPGTMSPYQHGEVFVTDDGAETDLDLGHYERFLNITTSSKNSFTAGKVYDTVIKNERRGKYLGKTIQVIPHITDEIKRRILLAGEGVDFCLVEVGGTCGDMESLPFQEAIRQLAVDIGKERSLFIHLTLLPYIKTADEIKTKPTQHSVRELRSIGIQPDVLICRSEKKIDQSLKDKISLFTSVHSNAIFLAEDTDSVYRVPIHLAEQKLDDWVVDYFGLTSNDSNLAEWEDIVRRIKNPKDKVRIAMVGKYVGLSEAYKSVNEALAHAGIRHELEVEIIYLDAERVEKSPQGLDAVHGILIPGGFGSRGVNGKIEAIRYARTHRVPFLGICLGMQLAVVEYARNVLNWSGASSTEWDKNCSAPVIAMTTEWQDSATGEMHRRTKDSEKGGTMRLGAHNTMLKPNSLAASIFGKTKISERHRHRHEVNGKYVDDLTKKGVVFSGTSEQEDLVEIIELDHSQHPWFFGCQFHPELKSTPKKGHPIFLSFITAALDFKKIKSD